MDSESTTETSQSAPASADADNAYYRSLSIQDVRCFGVQHLNLENTRGVPARWTLILGDNGSGKTTLLQLLALGATTDTLPPRARLEKFKRIPLAYQKYWSWLEELFRSGKDDPFVRITYNIIWSNTFDRYERALLDHAVVCRWWEDGSYEPYAHGNSSIVYGYGANRRRAPSGLTTEASDDSFKTLFDDDATLRNPEEWLLQNELVANTPSPLQESAKQQRARVREILTRVLPGIDDIRVTPRTDINQQVRASAQIHGPDGWIPFSALGLGYRTMTAWIVDFSSRLFERYGALDDPLSGAAVCLVDEIDLHLHPRWQRDLITRLTALFPNTQFIATAHSPLVVQAAPDANIVVLKRQGDSVIIDNAPRSVRKWRVDQILTSELFEIPSARAPELDAAIRERDEILARPVLSDDDERRLSALRSVIGDLPHGDTPEDIEAMDLIRRAANALRDKP